MKMVDFIGLAVSQAIVEPGLSLNVTFDHPQAEDSPLNRKQILISSSWQFLRDKQLVLDSPMCPVGTLIPQLQGESIRWVKWSLQRDPSALRPTGVLILVLEFTGGMRFGIRTTPEAPGADIKAMMVFREYASETRFLGDGTISLVRIPPQAPRPEPVDRMLLWFSSWLRDFSSYAYWNERTLQKRGIMERLKRKRPPDANLLNVDLLGVLQIREAHAQERAALLYPDLKSLSLRIGHVSAGELRGLVEQFLLWLTSPSECVGGDEL